MAVFDKRLPIEVRNQHPEKFNHAFVFLSHTHFAFAFLNEVKMRKTIVHAKLANSRKKEDGKNKRMNGNWCVVVYVVWMEKVEKEIM